MNIFNIASNFNFLEEVSDFASSISNGGLELSKITILLPSRRSCNELKRIFLNKSNGAILLPKIKAIGDIDYDDLLLKSLEYQDFSSLESFSSNTSRIKYKILLIQELLKWAKTIKDDLFSIINTEQICNLALELEKFLNEVVKFNLSLDNLNNIVDDEYSEHWQKILKFLQIFGKKWDNFIEENNIISSLAFKTKMIEFNTKFFETNKPKNPIIIAGVNGSIKPVAELIKNLIKYDNCYLVFKGLDKFLTDEEWQNINVFHPQYYFKNLIDILEIDRKNIKNLKENKENNLSKILSYSMLPYNFTYKWQDKLNLTEKDFDNISKIECKNSFEELNIISYILKYNQNHKSMAVITTNDNFAEQLEIMLNSLNLKCNNVFGNKISRTDVIKYLFLILNVIKSNFQILPLLSLLKHRFSLFNYTKNELNDLIFEFEEQLRGKGELTKDEIFEVIKENQKLTEFFKNIINYLNITKNGNFSEILKNHINIAENIASNNEIDAKEIFYNNEKSGNEVLEFLNELVIETNDYNNVENLNEYLSILNYLIAENSYSEKYSIHPTISIISPKEARLINFDLVIISNLNDGNFPTHISTDPWMSKSMRAKFGLNDKEEIIGDYAYDFVELLHNKEVILIRPLKDDGNPTAKSKYLMRLETFLECQNLKIQENSIWQEVFNNLNFIKNKKTINRPKPTPPLEKRPKVLYATKFEKLMKNPYDIYAEKVLKLKAKKDFQDDNIFATFGTAVHEALDNYIKNYEKLPEKELLEKLLKYGEESFNSNFANKITKELFFIRFKNIANWFIQEDEKIRNNGYKIYSEVKKEYYFEDLDFTIGGKIDRIEEKDNLLNIVDYKTNTAPSTSDVYSAKKPQLSIEAVILKHAGDNINKLVYWEIKGKTKDNTKEVKNNMDILIEKTENGLKELISYFNQYENSYIATCYELEQNHTTSDYKHLSRVEEWEYL